MGDYGIKVSKEGYGIDAGIEDTIFSSAYPFFKIHSDSSVNLTITAGNTSGYVDVDHSLGYVPAFITYVSFSWYDAYQRMMPNGVAGQPLVATAFADNGKVRCRINMTAQGVDRTFTFRVIIFKARISP